MENKHQWWKEAVIYQVYPRSFKDSNGDGVGDLAGILSELDYIVSLGVDAVWINPVYLSPGRDNGYDISDFRAIQPEYGTMEDMERLIEQLHDRKIRLVIDMVLNHTSDEHEWFRQARSSRENPYYSFYHWWPAEKGEPPHRCGFFDAKGRGWQYNEATDSYYLHYFAPEQPDLNWENPEVRRALYDMLRFWLDKGVDGLRMDAICFIAKDVSWPEISPELLKEKYKGDWGHYYAAGPKLHDYLREMREEVLSKYDVAVIAEASGISSDQALLFVDEDRKEMDMLYHFEGVMIGYIPGEFKKVDPGGFGLGEWKEVYTRWDAALKHKGWGTIYLGNHDQPRMVSRWGDDSEEFRDALAKLLLTFLLTMRGTPFIYNGDELGMTNIRFEKIDDYRDIETRQMYENLKQKGGDAEGFLKDQQLTGRDNSRTPFQWTADLNAGFTSGEPWISVNPNHTVINREKAEGEKGSVLNYFRELVRLRKENPVLVYGEYALLLPEHPAIYAYTRSYEDKVWTVLLNFSKEEQDCVVGGREIRMKGYGALILR
jgi:oligo-1,6-glucosidase